MTGTMEAGHALRGPLRKRDSHLWSRHADDWYVEPPWVSERLFDVEHFDGGAIHDPACGRGNIVQTARASGLSASGSDIVSRCFEAAEYDWLLENATLYLNIVSNPPFRLCDVGRGAAQKHPFVEHCLERAVHKVALLLPANWIQGEHRSRWLQRTPLKRVWFISPRPSMPPGPVIDAGLKPGNGTTDYAWFVWERGFFHGKPEICWLRRDARD